MFKNPLGKKLGELKNAQKKMTELARDALENGSLEKFEEKAREEVKRQVEAQQERAKEIFDRHDEKVARHRQKEIDAKIAETYPALAFDPNRPTRVHAGALLENLSVKPNGQFQLEHFNLIFLPETDVNGGQVQFGNIDERASIHIELIRDEELVCRYYYVAKKESGIHYRCSIDYNCIKGINSETFSHRNAILQPGAHKIRFGIDDTTVSTYEFDVIAQAHPDPYASPSSVIRANGMWNDHVAVSFGHVNDKPGPLGDVNNKLAIRCFFRSQSVADERSEVAGLARLWRQGEMVGESEMSLYANRDWSLLTTWMQHVEGRAFCFPDMEAGEYRLEIFEIDRISREVADQPPAVFEFGFKSGRFEETGKALKASTGLDNGGNTLWTGVAEGSLFWVD